MLRRGFFHLTVHDPAGMIDRRWLIIAVVMCEASHINKFQRAVVQIACRAFAHGKYDHKERQTCETKR